MKYFYKPNITLFFFIIFMSACVPKTAPSAPAAPSRPAAPVPTVTASTEEAAWAKVIEAAKREGKIVAYTNTLVGTGGTEVIQAFERSFGIKIETITGPGAVLIERMKSERAGGKYLGDTFDSAPSLNLSAKTAGLLQPWGDVPALAQKDVWIKNPLLDKERYMLNTSVVRSSPWINTALVKPEEWPKSLKDILLPKWKGKIGIASPLVVPAPIYPYVKGLVDDSYLRQLSALSLKVAPDIRAGPAQLARGEVALDWWTSDNSAGSLAIEGAPIKALEVEEGMTVAGSTTWSLLKDAPHPNASLLFVNWLISLEGNQVYTKATNRPSVRKDVAAPIPTNIVPVSKKLAIVSMEDEQEVDRIRSQGIMARLLGIEK